MRLFLAMVLAALWTAQAPPPPAELAAKIQARYNAVRDFEAAFVQTYEGGVLKTKSSESGTVAIKRPGLMRWTYTQPERKEFVSDGNRLYSYIPADKQVIVAPAPSADATTPALFLSGRGSIVGDFTASAADPLGIPAGLIAVRLTPKRPDPESAWITLGVDPATFQIRYLVAADQQGGRSTFTFSNVRENRNLSDKMFEFRIPRGVDVITNGLPK